MGEGLRLQHVSIQVGGLDGSDIAGHAPGEFGHQGCVVTATACDQQTGHGLGKMLGRFDNAGGRDGSQGGSSIGV